MVLLFGIAMVVCLLLTRTKLFQQGQVLAGAVLCVSSPQRSVAQPRLPLSPIACESSAARATLIIM